MTSTKFRVVHRLRYNHHFKMDVQFLTEDLKSPRYIPQLKSKLRDLAKKVESIDVDVMRGTAMSKL